MEKGRQDRVRVGGGGGDPDRLTYRQRDTQRDRDIQTDMHTNRVTERQTIQNRQIESAKQCPSSR